MRVPAMMSWRPCRFRVKAGMRKPMQKVIQERNMAKNRNVARAKVIRFPWVSVTAMRVTIFPRVAWFLELSR